jgi:hypothetical protein
VAETRAADGTPEVVGYLTGCADTPGFQVKKKLFFDLPLIAKIWSGAYPRNGDTQRFVKRALGLDRGPEQIFPIELGRELAMDYPAHLHTNVLTAFRGGGLGARLCQVYFDELKRRGVPGVHLYCGPAPLKFYGRQGFRELARVEFRPGVWVYALGLRLLTAF